MRSRSAPLALITACLLCGASAPSTTAETTVQRVARRGITMFWYDRAAWVSSDDLLAKLPANRRSEIGGWIVSPSTNGLHVDYFGKAVDRVVYAVEVSGQVLSDAKVFPVDAEPVLREPALRMAHALIAARAEMARHADWRSCAAAAFNTIVLPPETDNAIPVYFLTPQTENGSFPFGGHYEVDVAPDGHVASTRAFSRSCITLTKDAQPTGANPAALVVTHLLDPQPTEIHVFEQLYVGVPLFVGITSPRSMWKVENGKVTQVDSGSGAGQ